MPKYPVNDRKCDACGDRVAPGTPRRSVGDQMVCRRCFQRLSAHSLYLDHDEPAHHILATFDQGEKGLTARPTPRQLSMRARTAAVVKQAHDSGDQVSIYHCPFCGSGQVVGRSDRTVECTFCNAVFTVQVQPMYSAIPQTIDGMPVQEPGMPGMDGEPDVAPDEQLPGDPNDPGLPPGEDADADADGLPDDSEGGDDDASEDDDDKPAFLKGSRLYRTASGVPVPVDELINHMALLQATPEERPRVLAAIREGRRQ